MFPYSTSALFLIFIYRIIKKYNYMYVIEFYRIFVYIFPKYLYLIFHIYILGTTLSEFDCLNILATNSWTAYTKILYYTVFLNHMCVFVSITSHSTCCKFSCATKKTGSYILIDSVTPKKNSIIGCLFVLFFICKLLRTTL